MLKIIKNIINSALKQAVDGNMIPVNVCAKVKLPKGMSKEKQILSRVEQKKLEKEIEKSSNPLSFAVLFDLYTGLRVGELTGIKIDDIDFEKQELTVRRTIGRAYTPTEKREVKIINEPKTRKGYRTIPLPDFIMELLNEFIEYRNQVIEAMSENWYGMSKEEAEQWEDEGYLFITLYGTTPNWMTLRHVLHRLLKSAGIKKVGFHALRHTFATRCLEEGCDIKSLSDILGHTDARITLNIYAHALPDQKRNNMNKLAAIRADNKTE